MVEAAVKIDKEENDMLGVCHRRGAVVTMVVLLRFNVVSSLFNFLLFG